MTRTQKLIDRIVEDHAECRWMDASALRRYLEKIAAAQKKEIAEKFKQMMEE